jgi:hypothetical protein
MARTRRSRRHPASHISADAGGQQSTVITQETAGTGNGYDAVSASTMRGYIYWPQMDTRKEITSHTRIEICRRVRALCENVGLAGHIIECMADLIGYLTPMAATGDTEWNELANAAFHDTQSIPDVFDASGKFSFWEYQVKMDEAAFRDGDILPVLTETSSGTARIATYEAHQIANPWGTPQSVDGWLDGVKINRQHRHLRYSIVDPADRTAVRTISAQDCIYYGHFKKIGHVRPVSVLRAAINHLIDIGEIVRDVKYGIKVRNQIPLTVESQLGANFQTNSTQAIVGNVRQKSVPTTDGAGNATTAKLNYEEIMQGGNIPRLAPGQSLKALIDAAPHPNQLALLDWMVRDISWGCGLPPEIVWNMEKLRGANNRLLNSKLQRWIGARLLHKRNFVRRYWVYATAKAMKAGRLRECRDPEWWKVAMLPQENITADKGREGKLNIDLVANRMMSLQTFFALDGKHWLNEIRQMADEDGKLRELGLVVGDVLKRTAHARPEETDEPDDEDPAKGDIEDDEDATK